MSRPTRLARSTLHHAAIAAVALLGALPVTALARAVQPSATWTSASPTVDPSARCDLKSPAQIEQSFERGQLMPFSSYGDDPFVTDAVVECLPDAGFPPSVWIDAFTLDAPGGERREMGTTRWGNDRQSEQLERAGIVLPADAIAQ